MSAAAMLHPGSGRTVNDAVSWAARRRIFRVRTTVLNESAAPHDLWAVLGPTAGYDGRSVARLADSRYAAPTAEHIVPPGRELAYETTFPAGTGRLTLQYRADFRFEAVVVDDPGLLTGPS
jgi:hypothetical protein